MFGILAVGILVFVVLALLTWVNARMTARQLTAERATGALGRASGAVGPAMGAVGHSMRAYRSEVSLMPVPVQWGELLAPEEPPTIRIGGRPEPETPATSENWTPARTPALESDFAVPALQSVATAVAAGICAGLLSWALGWSWRVPVVILGLALAASWAWRLGVADSLLWAVESFTGKDLDNDKHAGRPQHAFTLANPGQARQTVAKEVRAATASAEQAELLQFLDTCFMRGTAEGKHGVKAAGPDRTAYLAKRDVLLNLGVARWKNPERPKAGWELAVSRQRARQVLTKHVL